MNNPHILLVHPPERVDELRSTLGDAGYRITVVTSATRALARLSAGGFDCVVSSYALPGDDGLSLFEAVCEIDGETPFVLFASDDDTRAEHAFDAGVDRFVHRNRSGSLDDLVAEIEDVTGQRQEIGQRQDVSGHEPEPEDIVRAIDEAPVGVSISTASLPDNPIVYINDSWESVTGYDESEALGRNPRFLQGQETDGKAVRAVEAAIENDRSTTIELRNYHRDGTPFWNELTVAPIRDETGEVVHYVGFQNDVTERKKAEQLAAERERRLTEEREALRRLLGRVNGLLREISHILMEKNDRQIIAQQICDEVADADGYAASWLGSVAPGGDELELQARTGLPDDVGTTLALGTLPDAVSQVVESDEISVCTASLGGGDQLEPETFGARRLAVVPLVYGQKRYGLLGVYGKSPDVLDRREQQLFSSVGEMIASRLNAIETARILTTDHIVELTIAVRDGSFMLSRVADTLDATVEYVGMTNVDDGDSYELFLTAPGGVTVSALTDLPVVEGVRDISDSGGEHTFAVTVASVTPFSELADHGTSVVDVDAEPNRAILGLELSPDNDVRSILGVLEELYEQVELRSRSERERHAWTTHEFASEVDEQLTSRQRSALEAAQMNGYFEWPRPTDGSEIADTMDITRQTFHQHLRVAEQKLVDAYVDCFSDDVRNVSTRSSTASPMTSSGERN